ncbi:MAG: 50S ribosomal protein L14e [Candidatus Aenigmarchaeota archaeon]|nr:50S ribosomal protein L14e [Candidatus Aenigmarchaeota archaeon]
MLAKGRIVLKIAGREAGKYAVVVENSNDGFVIITGPKAITGVKRRKCNVDHVEPTSHMLDIGAGDDAAVEKVWRNSELIKTLEIKIPEKREFAKKEKPAAKK